MSNTPRLLDGALSGRGFVGGVVETRLWFGHANRQAWLRNTVDTLPLTSSSNSAASLNGHTGEE